MDASKRKFLQYGFLSSSVFLFDGCSLFGVTTPYKTIEVLQKDLVPKIVELNIKTISYMHLVFRHKKISKSDKEFLKNGVKWLNEEAIKKYKREYIKLPAHQRQNILTEIADTKWGEDFLYDIMSYTFEAMLGDPIYSGNNNQAGWKWLEFSGGLPRPKKVYI
ncbi:gluconate 2-dehydrogenase subunit 3 family protein [Sulfurimonas sp. C5]|uniref:gluconate 2-dehydrogenase subunit 3 family protein n=1 Tax=Sulfurimonas sp. C5 TaxID=3036947 RepID=UPI0024553E0B|nr:gluconate 2-dehydrogenase subunit 3 family protein [Sulfurimonas sp. C5]MDH4944293.1 gluconate 2-dehydrogenase subunit 3 family protein [Sulfurimonas sp. C5]